MSASIEQLDVLIVGAGLSGIADDGLRQALDRLGQAVLGKQGGKG